VHGIDEVPKLWRRGDAVPPQRVQMSRESGY